MKIAIGRLPRQDSLSRVSSVVGHKVMGGDSTINAEFSISSSSDSAITGSSATVFGFGSDLLSSINVDIETGSGFSRSVSSSSIRFD